MGAQAIIDSDTTQEWEDDDWELWVDESTSVLKAVLADLKRQVQNMHLNNVPSTYWNDALDDVIYLIEKGSLNG